MGLAISLQTHSDIFSYSPPLPSPSRRPSNCPFVWLCMMFLGMCMHASWPPCHTLFRTTHLHTREQQLQQDNRHTHTETQTPHCCCAFFTPNQSIPVLPETLRLNVPGSISCLAAIGVVIGHHQPFPLPPPAPSVDDDALLAFFFPP